VKGEGKKTKEKKMGQWVPKGTTQPNPIRKRSGEGKRKGKERGRERKKKDSRVKQYLGILARL